MKIKTTIYPDEELRARLLAQAAIERRSLNQQILYMLELYNRQHLPAGGDETTTEEIETYG